jgi:tetratricopeptide (TPR) repeat protein
LDAEVTRQRMHTIRRFGLTLALIIGVVVFVLWGVDYFFPPNPTTILVVNTTNDVEQLAVEQKWDQALKRVQTTLKTLPNEPELVIWEAVLYEQLGDTKQAQASLAHAQQLTKDQPAGFWLLVGNKRFQVGNLKGAEDAANEALKIAPQEPQATLLLGGVAEARGDNAKAIDLFNKTADLARQANNPQLEVIAKMRMGTLMQQANPFQSSETPSTTVPITK